MKPWENGTAYPERGEIEPDEPGSSLVGFNARHISVAHGPVSFQRSESDSNWADKVVSRSAVDDLMTIFNGAKNLTKAGHALVIAEASALVESAWRAPTEHQKEAHMTFGRMRLSKLARKVKSAPGRVGAKAVRQHLAKE